MFEEEDFELTPDSDYNFEETTPEEELELIEIEYDSYRENVVYLVYKTIDTLIDNVENEVIDYLRFVWENQLLDIEQLHTLCLDKGIYIRNILTQDDVELFQELGFTQI